MSASNIKTYINGFAAQSVWTTLSSLGIVGRQRRAVVKAPGQAAVGYGWKETRWTGSYPMRGSDHMITTDPPPWGCPGLKGSKHSVTGGAQLIIYLMWMYRVLFQTFTLGTYDREVPIDVLQWMFCIQTLMSSLHGLLNCELCWLDCHDIA